MNWTAYCSLFLQRLAERRAIKVKDLKPLTQELRSVYGVYMEEKVPELAGTGQAEVCRTSTTWHCASRPLASTLLRGHLRARRPQRINNGGQLGSVTYDKAQQLAVHTYIYIYIYV